MNAEFSPAFLDRIRDDYMRATEEETAFFFKAIEGLPEIAPGKPAGARQHCVKGFRMAVDYFKPNRLFEVGFNLGYSAALWQKLMVPRIVSCDIRKDPDQHSAAACLAERVKNITVWLGNNSSDMCDPILNTTFDTCFIDGDHSVEGIDEDIKNCLILGCTKFIFDDLWPCYGATQEALLRHPNLRIAFICGNILGAELVQ